MPRIGYEKFNGDLQYMREFSIRDFNVKMFWFSESSIDIKSRGVDARNIIVFLFFLILVSAFVIEICRCVSKRILNRHSRSLLIAREQSPK